MKECIFCTPIEELVLFRTEYSIALLNYMQVDKVYALLVIPKRHVENILELNREEYLDLFWTARILTDKIYKSGETEFNWLLNEGSSVSGKNEPHTHLHIFTRKYDDKMVNMARPTRRKFEKEEAERTKELLL